jgi:hypothetical protein
MRSRVREPRRREARARRRDAEPVEHEGFAERRLSRRLRDLQRLVELMQRPVDARLLASPGSIASGTQRDVAPPANQASWLLGDDGVLERETRIDQTWGPVRDRHRSHA